MGGGGRAVNAAKTTNKGTKRKTEETKDDLVAKTKLFGVSESRWPVVYHPDYNISFCHLEKVHPFDAGKWGKVVDCLIEDAVLTKGDIIEPKEATEDDLKWSANVAVITEVPFVAAIPNFLVQRYVLKPFRLQVGGTILAARLALRHGWALNVGGGFHHCSADRGGGFCAYADITLALHFLFSLRLIERAAIVDLDAHQGNGHERDFMDDPRVYIMDMYNQEIYPNDTVAKAGIDCSVALSSHIGDTRYLSLLTENLRKSLDAAQPQLVVYNAGTDCLYGDPLGAMNITPKGVVERDQLVFEETRSRGIPVVMVTSGGYQRTNARVIADSIANLKNQGLITVVSD